MKKIIIYSAVLFLLIGCNSSKRDWEKARNLNMLVGYKDFLSKHPDGKFTKKALTVVDSIEWIEILGTHNVDSLELFVKEHVSSKFLTTSKMALDSLDWNIAYYSKDTVKLNSYLKKYPNSINKQKAENIIWEINWPPVKIDKANSVIFYTKEGGRGYGTQMFYQGSDGVSQYSGGMPPEVYIIREFKDNELKDIKKMGLRTGIAYLHERPNKFKFIKKVDLNKTDKQLCAEFGVSSE